MEDAGGKKFEMGGNVGKMPEMRFAEGYEACGGMRPTGGCAGVGEDEIAARRQPTGGVGLCEGRLDAGAQLHGRGQPTPRPEPLPPPFVP